jgi:hypothetical protein
VTENQWLMCKTAAGLLDCELLRPGPRRLRLLVCGSLRQADVWSGLAPSGRHAVEVAEAFADGAATVRELRAAYRRSLGRWSYTGGTEAWTAGVLANDVCWQDHTLRRSGLSTLRGRLAGKKSLFSAGVVRDVFGNPYRPVAVQPAWLSAAVTSLPQAAYDERDMPTGELQRDRLLVLADALEECGCTEAELLGHLRGPGPHVRGCWALDLVLGKG